MPSVEVPDAGAALPELPLRFPPPLALLPLLPRPPLFPPLPLLRRLLFLFLPPLPELLFCPPLAGGRDGVEEGGFGADGAVLV